MKNKKTYNLGLYEKSMPSELSLEEKLKEAKKAGFDFLELSIDESEEKLSRLKWTRRDRESLICSLWKIDLPILTLCLSANRKYPLGSENPETRNRGVEILEDAINLAKDLGIRIIQIAGYDEYYAPSTPKTREYFFQNLQKMVNMAAREGVILAFETMETDFINTVSKAMDYVKRIDSPYLQVYPDIGNITNAAKSEGHSLILDITSGRGHLAAMHLKETIPGKFREIPFGSGHVDFEMSLHIALQLGVSLFVSEFWYTGNPDWREQIDLSYQFIDRAFQKSAEVIL